MNKTIASLVAKHPDKIVGWTKDMDGYWIYLRHGWQESPCSECHTVHENTVKEVLEHFKWVCPCDCLECRTKGAEWPGKGEA